VNPIVRRQLAGPPCYRRSSALLKRTTALASVLILAGCASLSPDGGTADVQALVNGNPLMAGSAAQRMPDEASQKSVDALLARPLDVEAAVRIALINGPRVQDAFATLQLSDADRVQAASLPNPVLSFSRLAQGSEREFERMLSFNVVGLAAARGGQAAGCAKRADARR
jgi:histidine ammonia-lyase